MKSLRVPICAGGDDIIRAVKRKYGKDAKVSFALWPDGKLRIILNGTVGRYDGDENEN